MGVYSWIIGIILYVIKKNIYLLFLCFLNKMMKIFEYLYFKLIYVGIIYKSGLRIIVRGGVILRKSKFCWYLVWCVKV